MYNGWGQQQTTRETFMFYIRRRSIKMHETSRGVSFVAHLLQKGTDVHMGMVENSGRGGATTFMGATPHVDKMVRAVADHYEIPVEFLMDYYMDIAEGFEGHTEDDKRLIVAIASYKPE